MFDHVLIEGHELPGIDPERLQRAHGMEEVGQEDLAGSSVVFQTKDLENYVIKDGRLYERIYEHEDVPEEQRRIWLRIRRSQVRNSAQGKLVEA